MKGLMRMEGDVLAPGPLVTDAVTLLGVVSGLIVACLLASAVLIVVLAVRGERQAHRDRLDAFYGSEGDDGW